MRVSDSNYWVTNIFVKIYTHSSTKLLKSSLLVMLGNSNSTNCHQNIICSTGETHRHKKKTTEALKKVQSSVTKVRETEEYDLEWKIDWT